MGEQDSGADGWKRGPGTLCRHTQVAPVSQKGPCDTLPSPENKQTQEQAREQGATELRLLQKGEEEETSEFPNENFYFC